MSRLKLKSTIVVGILALIFFTAPVSSANDQLYNLRGEISVINPKAKVIEIEVTGADPVRGQLAPDAEVKKDERPAELSDFAVGETVTITYRKTADGPLIVELSDFSLWW